MPPIRSPPARGATEHFGKSTDGLELVPSVDIEVTALGYYDAGANGLVNQRTVGIFDTSSRKLVTPAVTVDTESALDGFFRYEPIAPVVLKGGRSYIVAGDMQRPFDPVANHPRSSSGRPRSATSGVASARAAGRIRR